MEVLKKWESDKRDQNNALKKNVGFSKREESPDPQPSMKVRKNPYRGVRWGNIYSGIMYTHMYTPCMHQAAHVYTSFLLS